MHGFLIYYLNRCFFSDFGIVLGCRIYVKEILNKAVAEKEGGLREGDVLLNINNSTTENLNLKEARKLIESTKERLQLLVQRSNPGSPAISPCYSFKGLFYFT